jgi:hypothetical protein
MRHSHPTFFFRRFFAALPIMGRSKPVFRNGKQRAGSFALTAPIKTGSRLISLFPGEMPRANQYLPKLFATQRGAYLQQHLNFMKGKPWVRHDEHYHVDFAIPCKTDKG